MYYLPVEDGPQKEPEQECGQSNESGHPISGFSDKGNLEPHSIALNLGFQVNHTLHPSDQRVVATRRRWLHQPQRIHIHNQIAAWNLRLIGVD